MIRGLWVELVNRRLGKGCGPMGGGLVGIRMVGGDGKIGCRKI